MAAFESQDEARLRRQLSLVAGMAWARGETGAVFRVRDICDGASLDSPRRYSLCCQILDSERFARRESLEYRHRTGVWGTGDATYTFTFATPKSIGPSRLVRSILWLLLLVGVSSTAFYLLQLILN